MHITRAIKSQTGYRRGLHFKNRLVFSSPPKFTENVWGFDEKNLKSFDISCP